METAILICIVMVGMLTAFVVGAKVGQAVSKGEKVELPIPNPVEAVRESVERREARREAKAEASRLDAIMQNIENYDGTSIGQVEVPRG